MGKPLISIITPTTGSDGLFRLIDSIKTQEADYEHILLWDDKREGRFLAGDSANAAAMRPEDLNDQRTTSITIKGSFVRGRATGSALRAVGLMAAQGKYITFADSDVWHEPNHLTQLLSTAKGKNWAFCRGRIWRGDGRYIGVDNFESVGDSPDRRTTQIMVDNNTMIVARYYGSMAATLYRETTQYDDDKRMTQLLYKRAGTPGINKEATVNQICPVKLESMFERKCTR